MKGTFWHSDWNTKKNKIHKWLHKNDWNKLHSPSLRQRFQNELYLWRYNRDCIVVCGWLLKFYDSKESYMNFGDDMNVYLFEKLTNKHIIPAQTLLFPACHTKYAFIGSIIPSFVDRNTIIWGSGCMDFNCKMNVAPKKVYAVRGPKTRTYLLKQGVDCPKMYVDPALLLPLVYQPKDKEKKYKITLIPHHHDFDRPETLQKLLAKFPDCYVINMSNYDKWTNVIDDICHSERVLSSSLHGLIVSDAYGIPNKFCEFLYHHPKYDKYEDYCEAVGITYAPLFALQNCRV